MSMSTPPRPKAYEYCSLSETTPRTSLSGCASPLEHNTTHDREVLSANIGKASPPTPATDSDPESDRRVATRHTSLAARVTHLFRDVQCKFLRTGQTRPVPYAVTAIYLQTRGAAQAL